MGSKSFKELPKSLIFLLMVGLLAITAGIPVSQEYLKPARGYLVLLNQSQINQSSDPAGQISKIVSALGCKQPRSTKALVLFIAKDLMAKATRRK